MESKEFQKRFEQEFLIFEFLKKPRVESLWKSQQVLETLEKILNKPLVDIWSLHEFLMKILIRNHVKIFEFFLIKMSEKFPKDFHYDSLEEFLKNDRVSGGFLKEVLYKFL